MASLNLSSMEDLPENLMSEILSRLPIKTIIHCKCVSKKWRNLVLDSYFANLHLPRSPPGLMMKHMYAPGILKWVDIEDEPNHHHLHHDSVMSLDLALAPVFQETEIRIVGSVDGLLCLWQFGQFRDDTYICNPITREYMTLPRQKYYRHGSQDDAIVVYGFGVGLQTKEYKVIRTYHRDLPSRPGLLKGEIYTLGTGQWRSLGHVPYCLEDFHVPFLNGHVHWIVDDEDALEKLCAFDFDNETFELFPSPPYGTIDESDLMHIQTLGVLKGCLCVSDVYETQFTLWVMKEYGIKTSWHREVVIKETISPIPHWDIWEDRAYHVLEYLKDGTILMVYVETKLLAYCTRTNKIEDTGLFSPRLTGITYRPSFLKLQDFLSEKVDVFQMPASF